MLKAALDKLWEERQDFQLDVHFVPQEMSPYIKVHNRYGYSELQEIFAKTDVLVAPSIWYETFGYTVLEALSFGVPVIMSGTVGAKYILIDGAGIVIEDISADKLCEEIKKLTPACLQEMNRIIVKKQNIMAIQDMAKEIEQKCYFG